MATARPGWSRKAQYSLFFSFIAAIAGLILGLVMLALSLVAPQSYAAVRGAALDATAPVTGGLRAVTATVGGLFSGAGNYWDAAHQNAQLKRERTLMIQRIVEAKAISLENRELKAALQLREHSRAPASARSCAVCSPLAEGNWRLISGSRPSRPKCCNSSGRTLRPWPH